MVDPRQRAPLPGGVAKAAAETAIVRAARCDARSRGKHNPSEAPTIRTPHVRAILLTSEQVATTTKLLYSLSHLSPRLGRSLSIKRFKILLHA